MLLLLLLLFGRIACIAFKTRPIATDGARLICLCVCVSGHTRGRYTQSYSPLARRQQVAVSNLLLLVRIASSASSSGCNLLLYIRTYVLT